MFWESISSHTHAFVLLYSMLWDKFSKNQVFSIKSCFLQNFDWSNLIFDQSKSCFKNSMSLCLVRLIKPVFRSIEDRISGFFKTVLWPFQNIFFKKVFKLFFSLRIGKDSLQFFCRFPPKSLQGFPPSKPVRPFYPSFWFYFHVFMHIFLHLKDIFETFEIWDFCWFKACFLKFIIGFCWDIVIFIFVIDYFDQFGVIWKIENSRVYVEFDLGILFNWVEIDKIGLLFWYNWSF